MLSTTALAFAFSASASTYCFDSGCLQGMRRDAITATKRQQHRNFVTLTDLLDDRLLIGEVVRRVPAVGAHPWREPLACEQLVHGNPGEPGHP